MGRRARGVGAEAVRVTRRGEIVFGSVMTLVFLALAGFAGWIEGGGLV